MVHNRFPTLCRRAKKWPSWAFSEKKQRGEKSRHFAAIDSFSFFLASGRNMVGVNTVMANMMVDKFGINTLVSLDEIRAIVPVPQRPQLLNTFCRGVVRQGPNYLSKPFRHQLIHIDRHLQLINDNKSHPNAKEGWLFAFVERPLKVDADGRFIEGPAGHLLHDTEGARGYGVFCYLEKLKRGDKTLQQMIDETTTTIMETSGDSSSGSSSSDSSSSDSSSDVSSDFGNFSGAYSSGSTSDSSGTD